MAARHFKVQISIITNLQFFGKYLEQSISKMVGDTQRAVASAYSVLRYITQIRRHKWGYYVSLPEIGDYMYIDLFFNEHLDSGFFLGQS